VAGGRRIERLGFSCAGTVALLALTGMPAGGALAGAPARPDLVEMSVVVVPHTAELGRSLRATDVVRNRGSATAARSTTGYYLSRDRAHGRGDPRLGDRSIRSLKPGETSQGSVRVRIPASAVPGSYRVLACADDRNRIRESDELNNCRASTQIVKVTRPTGGDRTPPALAGLKSATTCIPGPIGGNRKASYHLRWDPAVDEVTPSSEIVYDVYQATAPGGQDFSKATYTTPAGATSFATPLLPATKNYYFVVRARDRAGNRDHNRVERRGVNVCV